MRPSSVCEVVKAAPSGGYRCVECGWSGVRWAGRCSQCQAWGSIEERGSATGVSATTVTRARPAAVPARPIAEVDARPAATWATGVDELDQVLGGGLVSGAVVLLAGEPGTGKSTLLLDVASRAASQGRTVLYVSGEESAAQVRLRAERIGALRPAAAAGGRDRPGHRPRPRRGGRPRAADRRLGADRRAATRWTAAPGA